MENRILDTFDSIICSINKEITADKLIC